MDQLDYDSCADFLARLDADAENVNTDSSESSHSGTSSLLHSPFDESASPPGLTSGSVTSHSPESLRFDQDVANWDSGDQPVFLESGIQTNTTNNANNIEGLLPNNEWESFMNQDQPRNGQQQVISPMSDYIKIESDNPQSGYFNGSQTISPGNSLLDPTANTALEGSYSYGKDDDGLFNFNSYPPQNMDNPMMWRNTQQAQRDFAQQGWQQQSRPQQGPKRSLNTSLEGSPLRNSMSPPLQSPHSVSSPESSHSQGEDNPPAKSKKRKTSTTDDGSVEHQSQQSGGRKQPKKTAHNMIEKRYRTNLNDKIAALRDSVPSLRVMAGTSRLGEDDEEEDLEGLAPAHKLNKATVLAKATEYIRHLEKRNKRLQDENEQLKNRLSAFEKLATMGGTMTAQGPMVQQGGRQGPNGGPGGGLMSRLMVGSLAGLMVANGFQHDESGQRQLFAFPGAALEMFGVPGTSAEAGTKAFMLIFKLVLIFTAVMYVVLPGFFDSRSKPITEKERQSQQPWDSDISAAPSLASPLEVRRKAWLTSIQTVWVPRHSVGLELAALGLKAAKLSLRKLIGWDHYRMITGMTEEHEGARVKAWTIALDAQLTGGDSQINHSRLLLTFMASLTLPATPARLMLNAFHVRVLFSDIHSGLVSLAESIAKYYWNEARKAQYKLSAPETPEKEASDCLPDHLASLLDLDYSEVFLPVVIQKGYNLAHNHRTSDDCTGLDSGLDTVVEDVSIRSTLDALAAWYSSLVLQAALKHSLNSKSSASHSVRFQEELSLALRVAPPSSGSQLRALAAKSVLATTDGEKYLHEALSIFGEEFKKGLDSDSSDTDSVSTAKPNINVTPLNTAVTSTTDIRVALRCAMSLALMAKGTHAEALRLFSELDWRAQVNTSADAKKGLGTLGFVASWKTLTTFVEKERWEDAGEAVEKAAAMLRIWVGDKKGTRRAGIPRNDCEKVIDYCTGLQKRLAGLEEEDKDDGYCSGEKEDVEEKRSIEVIRPAEEQ